MNISRWPINEIMQLPDHVFGQRWPVGVVQRQSEIGVYYDISEGALPEKCVIWHSSIYTLEYATITGSISVSLGDNLPTTDAEFDAMEPLFRNVGIVVAGRSSFYFGRYPMIAAWPERRFVAAAGRRIVGRFEWTAAVAWSMSFLAVVSSIPTEVPDWLVSP